jgi:hypothetical protein
MSEKAFHGIAGDIVRALEPHTEADPAAVLTQLLVCVGNAGGRGPGFKVGASRHHTNLFCVIVGATSRGRKGMSFDDASYTVDMADPTWHSVGGLSTGEGLIHHVRDPVLRVAKTRSEKAEADENGYFIADEGVEDKRLLAVETEFASVLARMGGQGNTLSEVIRQAWDGRRRLATMPKANPETATGAHVSIIGHITPTELERALTTTEAANGFANRFLWIVSARSKKLPFGGDLDSVDWGPLLARLEKAIEFAKSIESAATFENADEVLLRERGFPFDAAASDLWEQLYSDWPDEEIGGLFAEVISRREPQVRRLAVLYAVLDCADSVRPEHLEAAVAVWQYSEASCYHLFGHSLGDPTADTLLAALKAAGANGLARTQINSGTFGRNKSSEDIVRALGVLERHGLAHSPESGKTGAPGRPAERWFHGPAQERTKRTKRTKSAGAT